LDVTMQRRIREFLAEYNRRTGATVLLTSHYMADVVALCRRVVVIHHGQILYDGALASLADRVATYKTIAVTMEGGTADLTAYGEVVVRDGARVTLRVPRDDAPKIAARLLSTYPVTDLTIEDPPIEDVIERVFAQGQAP
ncbi:MAG: ABC transporter, partial [bacterium]